MNQGYTELNPFTILNVGGPEPLSRIELVEIVRDKLGIGAENGPKIAPILTAELQEAMGYPDPLDLGMDSSRVEGIFGRKLLSVEEMMHFWRLGVEKEGNGTQIF